MPTPTVRIGLESEREVLAEHLGDRDFGLLMNQASVTWELRSAFDILAQYFPGRLRTLFSPQHGIWGEQQANMIESPHGNHGGGRIPIHSLYSETRRPTQRMLDGVHCLVVDLQDVGTRVYTFVWTVTHCLEACAERGVRVVVLDRPNPLGASVEGPCLDLSYTSFVGRLPIPMRHGLTIGELSLMANRELRIGAELSVVPVRGWRPSARFDNWNRPWIYPSPNLPHWSSVLIYPGQVLLEGTNLSEGRGTTLPFEMFGAPFVEPHQLKTALESLELPGVRFLPVQFCPSFDKWAGQSCRGLWMYVSNPSTFRPYLTSVAILASVRRLWPNDFTWIRPPYEYEERLSPIDIISGSDRLRTVLDESPPGTRDECEALACLDGESWFEVANDFRLYKD